MVQCSQDMGEDAMERGKPPQPAIHRRRGDSGISSTSVRLVLVILVFWSGAAFSAPVQQATTKRANQTNRAVQENSKRVPRAIETASAGEANRKTTQEQKHEAEKVSYWRWVSDPAWWLVGVTAILAFFTFRLWLSTFRLARDARESSARQGNEMRESIEQNTRAAGAMERVARTAERNTGLLEENWRRQMRAYLTVIIGSGAYQDREKNIKFEVKPVLLNSGFTPAHRMDYWATAGILPFPLPETFDFPVPQDIRRKEFVLGPHQNIMLNAFTDDFVPDEEVAELKAGRDRRIYIWGEVTYEDVFGEHHETRFCHSLFWYGTPPDELVSGTYAERYNEAT